MKKSLSTVYDISCLLEFLEQYVPREFTWVTVLHFTKVNAHFLLLLMCISHELTSWLCLVCVHRSMADNTAVLAFMHVLCSFAEC